ncbi:MAG: polyphosphate:AMP phosphotransferase [Ruminococcus sp.]|jgi:polyphosphate:AMP phosphotransferase|nr:polyphosphate:AMP phosphotransferase [Ruminococcus sp.]
MLEKALKNSSKSFDFKDMTKQLEMDFSRLQQEIAEKKLPVIILLEGWGASGKGAVAGEMIKMLDPRFFRVYTTAAPSDTEKRFPMMKRHWEKIPEKGKITILDRSWYQDLAIAKMESGISDAEYKRRITAVNTFERQLNDDGYLIIKFFLHISKDEQKKRFGKLREDDATRWRVTETDKKRNKNYSEYFKQFDNMLEKTNTPYAQWRIIDTSDRKFTRFQVYNTLVSQITNALNIEHRSFAPEADNFTDFKLSSVDLSGKTLTRDKYESKLKSLQKDLARIHSKLYNSKIPVVILFEGWDAAGKGGAIKRLAATLDPRGYEAVPIAAPELHEFNRHYLWRFWGHLPKTGHITIFDRTWYGRVMVEPIEGITPRERAEQAYNEINEFERELTDSGVVIIKFWLQIDKDEQLRRFKERENDPFKKWKITSEDWRNREKWDEYEPLIERMIGLTSTAAAPWNVIEANDKLFARIKVLKTVEDRLDEAISQKAKADKKKSEKK